MVCVVVVAAACGDDGGQVAAGSAPSSAVAEAPPRYEASGTVLESPEHGPELCLAGQDDSYPPQCRGTELVGWDWATVDDEESANGTTWGGYHVIGTWDGQRLTVTEAPGPPQYADTPDPGFEPACDEPTGDPAVTEPIEEFDGSALGGRPDVVRTYVTYDPFTVNVLVRPGATEAVTTVIRDGWEGLLCVAERDEPTEAELRAVQQEVEAEIGQGSPLGEILGVGVYALEPYVGVSVTVLTPEGEAYAHERWGDLVQVTGRLQPVE